VSTQAKTKAAPTKSAAKPAKLVSGKAAAPAKKPVSQAVVKPKAGAAVKPVVKAASKASPVKAQAAKSTVKSAVKTTAKPVSKSPAKSPVKTAPKPAVKSTVKAPAKTSAKTSVKAAVKTPAKVAAKPVAKAAVKPSLPAAKPASKLAPQVPVKAPVKASVKALPESAHKAVVKEPVKALAKKTTDAPAKPAVKTAVKEAAKSAAKPAEKDAISPAPAAKVAAGSPVLMPIGTASSGGIPRAGRPSSRLASLTVPSMAQSVASTAAKASYAQIASSPMIAPPLPSSIKKDPKLANNWKTTPADKLSDAELMAMSDDEYMNDKQLAAFRHRLVQLKNDILTNAGQTTENLREDTVVVPDPADRATIEEEHALELRTRDRERKLLKKIEQSISRIDAGDYGYCDETGEPIGVGRLLARPTATLSLEAQQRRELKQKMFGD